MPLINGYFFFSLQTFQIMFPIIQNELRYRTDIFDCIKDISDFVTDISDFLSAGNLLLNTNEKKWKS